MPVVAPRVRGQQPLHPAAQVPTLVRPQHQVKVIRQDAIPKHIHRQAVPGVDDALDKRVVITWFVKDRLASIAAIERVVDRPGDSGSGGSWHDDRVAFRSTEGNKALCPHFSNRRPAENSLTEFVE
jgi:hypothetical protein